jgi:hypothetical protein
VQSVRLLFALLSAVSRWFYAGRREYVVEAVGSAVTDRACLLGVKWSGCAALTVTANPDSMGPHCTQEDPC